MVCDICSRNFKIPKPPSHARWAGNELLEHNKAALTFGYNVFCPDCWEEEGIDFMPEGDR